MVGYVRKRNGQIINQMDYSIYNSGILCRFRTTHSLWIKEINMDVIHIAEAKDGNFLVTYMFTPEEFEAIQEQAKAKGELDEDSNPTIQ